MLRNSVTKEPTLFVIISEEFVAARLSSVDSAESKSWRPQIERKSPGADSRNMWLITNAED